MFAKRYAKLYNRFHSDKEYEKEAKLVYKMAEEPTTILDIGSGTGAHWKFYPKGTCVIGIEKSLPMAMQAGATVCADVTKFRFNRDIQFDCATALFDVLNYIPNLDWFGKLPIKKGGFFVFDIWNKTKVDKEGFSRTQKTVGDTFRIIEPGRYDGKSVKLKVTFGSGFDDLLSTHTEIHKMFIHSHEDILKACGKQYEIVSVRMTPTWQMWYKLRRK